MVDEELYACLHERAEYALNEVEGKIRNIIRDLAKKHGGKVVIHHYHSRIKSLKSILEKMERQGYLTVEQITDLLGFRLVCLFPEYIPEVCEAIDREFAVDRTKNYIDDPKPPERGGYTGAVHKKISVQVTVEGKKVTVPMEIQVTDVIMSAVWETEHDINYKSREEDQYAQDDNQILIACVKAIHMITSKRRGGACAEECTEQLQNCISIMAEILARRNVAA